MNHPERLLDRLTQLARTASPPQAEATAAFADQLLRQLRGTTPESALAAWHFFAVRALSWAAAALVVAAGFNAVVTSKPLPDPASELLVQFTQP